MTPRGQRTAHLVEALRKDWSTELISFGPDDGGGGGSGGSGGGPLAGLRPLVGRATRAILYDPREPWSIRRFARWEPQADAAVMVAAPWSPPAWAGRRLRAAGIPYVLDVGDPWSLTPAIPLPRTPATRRAMREEAVMWEGASGAMVTTRQQGQALASRFPGLELLVLPNGYDPGHAGTVPAVAPHDPSVLRLVHFGLIYAARLDVMPLLARLRDSGRWRSISFTQFGDVYERKLDGAPEGVEVVQRPAVPWNEVVAGIGDFDAAVVLGNLTGDLLPSKAIQYLTLPIPRIAVTDTTRDDALAEFAAAHEAWLAISPEARDPATGVAALVDREWSAAELRAPEADSWPAVGARLAEFVNARLAG
jgi:hypothetical protein